MESEATTTPAAEEAQRLVRLLNDRGLSAADISDKLAGRVSARTVYRWAKGESTPQQTTDLAALRGLAEKKGE
jgi:ribosome-binding protein aMBF1 (putative translation factor)